MGSSGVLMSSSVARLFSDGRLGHLPPSLTVGDLVACFAGCSTSGLSGPALRAILAAARARLVATV